MIERFGKWPEVSWSSEHLSGEYQNICAGVDIGTTSTQAAIISGESLLGYVCMHTGADFGSAAQNALERAAVLCNIKPESVDSIGVTGFGKRNAPFAAKSFDEIHCHAKGARFMYGPEVRTIVDMGGQTVKAIRLYEWDRGRDFMIGDKCATGHGRNIEVLCDLLHIDISEIGEKSLMAEKDPEPVSTTCPIFANSETLGLFGRPEYKSKKLEESEIYASHLFAVAWRILGVIGRLSSLDVGEIQIDGGLALTGGLAKNSGITARIERELNVKAAVSEHDPMIAGAIGAALLAGI